MKWFKSNYISFSAILIFNLFEFVACQRSCFTCEGDSCLSSLSGFITRNCATENDECVTIYDNFTPIRRACYSSLNNPEQKEACDSNNIICSKCSSDNCNNLGREDHKCLYCNSLVDDACLLNVTEITSIRCAAPLYTGLPKCFVKSIGMVTERGCVVTPAELDQCSNQENNTLCSSCDLNSNNVTCNTYVFPENRRICAKCSGRLCGKGTNEVSELCLHPDDECMSLSVYEDRVKGCKQELTEHDHEICGLNPERCSNCSTNYCNSETFNFPKVQCRVCNSTSDIECINGPKNISLLNCIDGCITYLQKDSLNRLTTQRSCYEDAPEDQATNCGIDNQTNENICRSCLKDDCNSDIFPLDRQSCYTCDSSCNLTATQNMAHGPCEYYSVSDHCGAILKNEILLQLNCLSSMSNDEKINCESDKTCSIYYCDAQDCNSPQKFQNRATCVDCDSSKNIECATNPNVLNGKLCPLVGSTSFCYSKLIDKDVKRGCLLDLDWDDKVLCEKGENCEICNGNTSTGCNNQIYPFNRLACHECSSTVLTSNCANETITQPKICVKFDVNNRCYSIIKKDGTILRTCSNDEKSICAESTICNACPTIGCNSGKIVKSSCGKIVINSFLIVFSMLFIML